MICLHRNFDFDLLAVSIEKNYTLKCFKCSTNNYSFEESIRALHSTPLQVSKRKKRNTCMLIREMLQDYIILTTFLLYLFNQGDFHETFLFFSKAKDRKLKFTGALERSMIQIMARPFYKTSGFGCSAL